MKPMRAVLGPLVAGMAIALAGCESTQPSRPREAEAATPAQPLPSYIDAATRYNAPITPLDQVIARATMRLTYVDQNGEERTEQPDGTLQVIRPTRLAIDLGKAGQKMFWFGSDDERYWWLDLTDSNERVAYVGRHERWDASGASERIGLAVSPLDLIAALGITPLDLKAPGRTQWSRDGKRLGIVVPLERHAAAEGTSAGSTGLKRIWVDPRTMAPQSIELFDAQRQLVLRAVHTGQERVQITRTGVPGSGQARPPIAAQITCTHPASGASVRITLSDAKDAPISPIAFVFEELVTRLGIDRVVDLDKPEQATRESDKGGA